MRNRRLFKALSVLLAITLTLAMSGIGLAEAAPKTVTMAVIDVFSTLNPYASSISELSGIVQAPIYLEYAKVLSDGSVQPLLLEGWEVSEDGKTYTVHVRKDMYWHDGEPITADDVEWTFKTFSKPGVVVGSNTAFADFEGVDEKGYELSDGSIGVTKVDDYTLTWKLKYPISPAALFYDMRSKVCVPKHVLDGQDPMTYSESSYWYTNPVGSGPFKFSSMVEGERVEYDKFDQFALGDTDFDHLIIRVVPAANLLSGLMSGDIDILAGGQYGTLPTNDVEMAREQENLTVDAVTAFTYQYISINNSAEYLSDVRVRKAINMAIDKERIVNEILQGEGNVACLPYATIHPYFKADLAENLNVYDPEGAKALLAEAGWDSSRVLTLGTPSGNIFRNAAAVLVQQDLAEVGIQVEIQQYDNATLMSMLTAGEMDLATMGSAGAVEPSEPYNLYNPDGAYCFACLTDYTYVDLLNKGLTGLDFESRAEYYYAFQDYIIENAPYAYLCNPNILLVYNNSRLSNINSMNMTNSYRAYWDWKVN